MIKKSVEKRISKVEKRLLDNMKSSKQSLVSLFYILSVLCIAYPIIYYTIFIHQFNFESTITFFYMLMGMALGFGSCIFFLIGNALEMKKVKL